MARPLRPGDDAAALRAAHDRRRAKAVAGLDEVTRAALEAARPKQAVAETAASNVVELASRRRQA